MAAMVQTAATTVGWAAALLLFMLIGGSIDMAIEAEMLAARGLRRRVWKAMDLLSRGVMRMRDPYGKASPSRPHRRAFTLGWFALACTPLAVVIAMYSTRSWRSSTPYIWLGSDSASIALLVAFCVIALLHLAVCVVGFSLGQWNSSLLQQLDLSKFETVDNSGKFCGNKVDLISGQPKNAAMGIFRLMQVNEKEVQLRMTTGVQAIIDEFEAHGTESDKECLHYVLHQPVGFA